MDNHFTIEDSQMIITAQKGNEKNGMIEVPVYQAIPCGSPNFIDNELQGYIEIPEKMLGTGEFFILRAKGTSMIDAGINDQDLVIIRKQEYAEENQIAVALVEGEVTLKRIHFDKENRLVVLMPENSEYSPIITKECTILGVAVKVIKDL